MLTGVDIFGGAGGSSLTSKRLDMAPLCHVTPPELRTTSEVGIAPFPLVPARYMAAFPFPGRCDGKRFTMTEEDRGIIWESSLHSKTVDEDEEWS